MRPKVPTEGKIVTDNLDYSDVIDCIDEGVIHIPEFQREFVWEKSKILDLLDSIYKGYPIGSIILWLTDNDFEYSATIADNVVQSNTDKYFVIDGQQRLKSFYHAAKSKEIKTKQGVEDIDVHFDLKKEEFVFAEDIRNRRKGMYYIPAVKKKGMIFDILKLIKDEGVEQLKKNFDLTDNSSERFLRSLTNMKLIYGEDGSYELTEKGIAVLENKDVNAISEILVKDIKYVKEALDIIIENPGINRKDGGRIFQEYYGGSEGSAYQQFGRRCRWFRSIGLVNKEDGELYPEDIIDEIIDMVKEIEDDIEKRYIPLSKILIGKGKLDFDYLFSFPEYYRNKISKLREKFSDFPFSLIIVNKDSWDEVCDIFERINTKGQHLTIVDLMMAKTWQGDEFNLRDELKKFRKEIDDDIPDVTILKIVSMNVSGKCTREAILSLSSNKFTDNWDESLESLRKTIDLLKNDLNIPKISLIPFPDLLVPLSKFYFEMGNETPNKWQKDRLIEWFWRASISNRFDSAVDSKLEKDKELMEGFIQEIPLEINYTYPQRDIEDIAEQKYSLNNAFAKTILCLFSHQEPRNIVNHSFVTNDSFSKFKSREMHHIFPRNYLRKQGVEREKIDSIANIMFLPANVHKKGKFKRAPSEYLKGIENDMLEDDLETHLIDNIEDSGLLDDNFEKFLRYRSAKIRDKLRQVSGEENIFSGGRLTPERPFTNEIQIRKIIRQARSYIYWIDKYFTRKGLEFLVEEVNVENVDEIRILTGTKQTTHTLRKDFKKFKQEMENMGVDAEFHIISETDIRDIHDRWIIAENETYNVPSINTIGRGQHSEITVANSKPPFDKWWKESTDIIEEWNKIQKRITN